MASLRVSCTAHVKSRPLHFTPKLKQICWFHRLQFGISSLDKILMFRFIVNQEKKKPCLFHIISDFYGSFGILSITNIKCLILIYRCLLDWCKYLCLPKTLFSYCNTFPRALKVAYLLMSKAPHCWCRGVHDIHLYLHPVHSVTEPKDGPEATLQNASPPA